MIRSRCRCSEKDLKTDKAISFYTKKCKKGQRNLKRYKKLLSEKVAKQEPRKMVKKAITKAITKAIKKEVTKIVLFKIMDKVITLRVLL